jgi:hypothetical protein
MAFSHSWLAKLEGGFISQVGSGVAAGYGVCSHAAVNRVPSFNRKLGLINYESANMSDESAFLSYAREDSEAANRLYNDLAKSGVTVWFDKQCLLPGQKWEMEIRKAIRNSRYFLALLSSSSVTKRGFVQREIASALRTLDEFPELQWVDLFPSWKVGVEKILSVMRKSASSPIRAAFPPAELFYGLGNHIALLSWVTITDENAAEVMSAYNRTLAIIAALDLPNSIASELRSFFQKKRAIDEKGNMKIIGERMLALRDLFGLTIRSKFGPPKEGVFQFGFLLTNVVYMCENAAILPLYRNFVLENSRALTKKAEDMHLPIDKLEKLVDLSRVANTLEEGITLYSDLCQAMTYYEDAIKAIGEAP